MIQKISIQNKKNQKLVLVFEKVFNAKGLAFVAHGLSGTKEAKHIVAMAEAFREEGYSTIRFDTTNTFGESDGDYADATVTSHYKDLEDIIFWAKKQDFYQEPFFLTGHSLGGMTCALYAQTYPTEVKGLVPISTVVSGALSLETETYKAVAEEWKTSGWREEKSYSRPGLIKRLKWSHMEDRLQYNLLDNVDLLQMPVLLVVGSEDKTTPFVHQQILYKALPGEKRLHVIDGAAHTIRGDVYLEELKRYITDWLDYWE